MSYTRPQAPKPYDIRKKGKPPTARQARRIRNMEAQQRFDNEVSGAVDRYLKKQKKGQNGNY